VVGLTFASAFSRILMTNDNSRTTPELSVSGAVNPTFLSVSLASRSRGTSNSKTAFESRIFSVSVISEVSQKRSLHDDANR
jgi:hypothetical protein